ncbi:MAG: hypothetical protein HW390_2095 [Candidatus Brocadiaceae bacterium]|nr:hypothetical protein [Candidatus Brocadiaceae bacterium]
MVINHSIACKQPCIIHVVICRDLYLPTDSADEAKITRRRWPKVKSNGNKTRWKLLNLLVHNP